ncbi:MAG TPA: MaoC family dehydratase N-terminal domain-containing protein [Myxococcota bacterium]|nr:MaoC family dehydratase N-terminal domain-containing protein [Myxococcota bacterium]
MAVKSFPVEASHILMFARAVNDPNPIYSDEQYARKSEVGGILAPPTFTQASAQFDPDYFLRPKIGQPWFGSGREPSGALRRAPAGGGGSGESRPSGAAAGGLHAEQHFEYHRPVLAGDLLTAETRPGKTWEREGRRGGKLHFSESITDYRNQRGELVVTARGVGVRTERVIEQK